MEEKGEESEESISDTNIEPDNSSLSKIRQTYPEILSEDEQDTEHNEVYDYMQGNSMNYLL